MSLAVIGVAGAVIGAGATAYSSYSSSSAAKKSADARVPSKGLIAAAAGTVPVAARYKPVDFTKEQLASIDANRTAAQRAGWLTYDTNRMITADALQRISRLVPGYSSSMQKYGAAASSLLGGHLPFNDVMGIAGHAGSLAGSLGIAGTGGPATLRDLGLSELQGIQTGGSILKDMVGMAETISPRAGYMTPQQMFVSPSDRIRNQLEQHQLVQQSDQNANNLAAEGDPAARLQLGLQTSGALSGYTGGSPGTGALVSGIGSLAGSLSGLGGGGGGLGSILGAGGAGGSSGTGGFSSIAQAGAAAPYAGGYGYLSGAGYVPRAQAVYNPGGSLQAYTG